MARKYPCCCCGKDLSGSTYDVWTYLGSYKTEIMTYAPTKYEFGELDVLCHSCSHRNYHRLKDDRRWEHTYHHVDGEVEYL